MIRPTRFAQQPPMPADPTRCRWCEGRKRAVMPGLPLDTCDAGCCANDRAPYRCFCEECRLEFFTGRSWMPTLCFECEKKEIHALTAGATPGPGYYHFAKVGRGGHRNS